MRTAALAVLFVLAAACGSGDEPAVVPAPPEGAATSRPASGSGTATAPGDDGHVEVVVAGGTPDGGVRTASVDAGERVVLTITSDTADEVHGYDLTVALVPGEPEPQR